MPSNQDKPMQWKNISGTFNLRRPDGEIEVIQPGSVFTATQSQVPRAFRDTIRPVDPTDLEEQPAPAPTAIMDNQFKIVPRPRGGFNVVNSIGKAINERSLTEAEADVLLNGLRSVHG